MIFKTSYIDKIAYEKAPNILTNQEIEERLAPAFKKLHIPKGQFKLITGIEERRFWDDTTSVAMAATIAGQKALEASNTDPSDIDVLIFCGVCREYLEPAVACEIGNNLKISKNAQVYDITNACLGVANGIIQVASFMEAGYAKKALLVSAESSKEIIDRTIKEISDLPNMQTLKDKIATLTGGSGAVAVLLSNQGTEFNHKIIGASYKNSLAFHDICKWGPQKKGLLGESLNTMVTDSAKVLENGLDLAKETFEDFTKELSIKPSDIDKIICHQVGSTHQKKLLEALKIPLEKDFSTYKNFGNMGTVSFAFTAAMAEEAGFLNKEDLVGFFGIGSGLNCLMLGIRW